MKNAGVKRGGVMVAQDGKFLIELLGTEQMGFPIKLGSKKLVDWKYLEAILPKANKMLSKNYRRIEKLEGEFRKALR